MKTKTKKVLNLLQTYEAANMLWVAPDGSWPIVWEKAQGVNVWDADGRKYIDLTAAFGVAAAGHGQKQVVAAGQRQMGKLLHAMGDVHPHALKAELARELSRITFERWTAGKMKGKTMFSNSGFEAVEAALKTAILATGKRRILAFTGAYHGLGYGALNATHRHYFRQPFQSQLGKFGQFVRFPNEADDLAATEKQITKLLKTQQFGAILVEPIQGRGGVNVPPPGFLRLLRTLCDQYGVLLIADEIFTGFGRTGSWFACEHDGTTPDLICLGKALTGGFPMSACVGRADIMDAAWPPSAGEAIHTSTFQGHPVGCAMALAQIKEIEEQSLPERSAALGKYLMHKLREEISMPGHTVEIRGRGLMVGLELKHCKEFRGLTNRSHGRARLRRAPIFYAEESQGSTESHPTKADGSPATELVLDAVKQMLHRGFILLPEGEFGNVISFSPPLIIAKDQLASAVRALKEVLA